MSPLRTTAGVLGVLAAVALVLVQFLPWGGVSASFGGFGGSSEAYTWHLEASGTAFGQTSSDRASWYSDDVEDDDSDEEVRQVRIAIPLLLGGLALAALGGILALATRSGAASILLMLGGILAAIATLLFSLALDSLFESEQEWAASFYLAIAGSALALVGGVLGLVAGNRGSAA